VNAPFKTRNISFTIEPYENKNIDFVFLKAYSSLINRLPQPIEIFLIGWMSRPIYKQQAKMD
jgi:hypothetical protein